MRRGVLLICAAVGLCVGLCIWFAQGLPDFRQNLLLNLAPELLTTIVTLLVIQPILTRLEEERVREHLRLDYPSFCDKVAHTQDIVCVLDTFSYLLSGNNADRFADAACSAIGRGATVRVMLLDPDSLAARQRSHELSADVRREIMRNLRDLRQLEERLPAERRDQLQVRVYTNAPSIQLYRCGERMMVSFYPVDRLSGEGQQLEVRITTPLGAFVSERFAELWTRSRPVEEVLTKQVRFLDSDGAGGDGGAREPLRLEYVDSDGDLILSDRRLVVELARHRDGPVHVTVGDRPERIFRLELVDIAETDSLARLRAAFVDKYGDKYGEEAEVFVRLDEIRPSRSEPEVSGVTGVTAVPAGATQSSSDRGSVRGGAERGSAER
ncbi:hypothetical protein [Streptacidiphilus fuscans]|uniref:Uncharacterized protein n=1 Tax=Streptacidiphilus fuscans TaxID=2789292 RepID=A0A931BCI1_9ACTN|nr:hypothetical protein [Streptacidiphilus fuscans]MBF9073702.1 hypothetical protein [Streptacidiphilus fuscans]